MQIYQSWRENELNALLKDLRDSDIGAPEPTLDQAAELQRKWNTKLGQIWLALPRWYARKFSRMAQPRE
jgi:hypothetical protein